MSINRRDLIGASLALGMGAAGAQPQNWPSKPIRLVVPYPPGGSSDIIARSIAQPLSEALKQSVIVENKAGANGNLGADFVAKSGPDGYTLLLCDTGALAISPSVYTKLPFDPSKDLRGVTMRSSTAKKPAGRKSWTRQASSWIESCSFFDSCLRISSVR